ncbi:beta-hexosaminidase [Pseudoxanthomonas broegbernensis]|uniref:beta-N-acetylhexosaminidase n=1 Tax=Pseudoxanthomonas broegbernensis TaxID=83619 RepID=A0A7V8GKJ6_9GAMM|nr:family 20 glycosylhydrolase [Pseudoxanthomonas broegbernensis]KAF1685186.1 beta-hexosaminidase [Pseudoxanthomonas broegbernensis]MBB6065321.1 hexosaminidase [Pseudoxanthomonas broegbernensis]
MTVPCRPLLPLAAMLALAMAGTGACAHAHAEVAAAAQVRGAPLIPRPASIRPAPGRFLVDAGTAVRAEGAAAAEVARQFAGLLGDTTPIRLAAPLDGDEASAAGIVFRLDANAGEASPEAYSLDIGPRRILVRAGDARGLFYGAMSLWQLLAGQQAAAVWLPAMRIEDAPRFGWRGLMLDSARHFQSVEQIKSLLDAMAVHKLNTFHWHLTDDQGWRIQIERYPKLTQIGGCRIPAGEAGTGADGTLHPYCGHYTREQIREVVAHAAARHITVVPEIDVPGHAQAAVAAYPEHGVVDGPTEPSHNWGVNPYLFNPREETVRFLEDILEEVIELFPGPYVHIGGDEAVKYQWQASPQVQALIGELGLKDEEALQSHVLKRLEAFLEARGRKLIGWDEIIEGGLPPQATVMSWRGIEGGIEAATRGHDVVMVPGDTLYLDFLQTDLPDEPPGRPKFTSMQKIYAFDPVPGVLTPAQRAHVLGVQANVWTEHMRTFERVQHNVFPRLSALAEIAWTAPARKDYGDFLARLPAQLQRYRALGIPYAQTALAVALQRRDDRATGTVTAALSNPLGYLDIRYTTDGSAPTAQSAAYTAPLTLEVPTELKAAAFFDGRPLADRPSAWPLDGASLLTRTDKTLAPCPRGGRLLLRLEDDNPPEGPRASFDVTIFHPCWQWQGAQLDGIAAVKVRAGRIPYNFGLLREEESTRGYRAPVAAHGEFEARAGCDGPVLASVPLPEHPGADGFVELEAPLRAAPDGRTDLCLTFSGDTRPQMWVLDRVTLQPGR